MSTLIRNVRDLEAANRRSLESLLGQSLQDDAQVLIRVIGTGTEPDAATKRAALNRAYEISERADLHRESTGVSVSDTDRVIDEAIDDIRQMSP